MLAGRGTTDPHSYPPLDVRVGARGCIPRADSYSVVVRWDSCMYVEHDVCSPTSQGGMPVAPPVTCVSSPPREWSCRVGRGRKLNNTTPNVSHPSSKPTSNVLVNVSSLALPPSLSTSVSQSVSFKILTLLSAGGRCKKGVLPTLRHCLSDVTDVTPITKFW